MATNDRTSRIVFLSDATWRAVVAPVLLASEWLGLGLGLFLIVRRLSGALDAKMPPLLLVATGLALMAWLTCVRMLRSLDATLHDPACTQFSIAKRIYIRWAPILIVLVFAVGCSYPGDRVLDWLVWAAVMGVLGLPWRAVGPPLPRLPTSDPGATEEILQQVTRFRGEDGREAIRGMLLAEFALSERNVTLFVAFCPPFERLPVLEVECQDALATVKVVQCLHHGAQLEVRLAESAEEALGVTVAFLARDSESGQESL